MNVEFWGQPIHLHSDSFLRSRGAGCRGIRGQEDRQVRAYRPVVVRVKADPHSSNGVVGEVFGVVQSPRAVVLPVVVCRICADANGEL